MGSLVVKNKCTSCGGGITDPNFKNCPHCGAVLDAEQKEIDEKNKNVELCPNCGSPVIFNIEKQEFSCDYCHSAFSTEAENAIEVLTFEADELIPFQVSEGLAKKRFLEWLIVGESIPTDVIDKIRDIHLEQLYVPYMGVKIAYDGSWSADIGYTRSETYTDFESKKDSNGHQYSEPVKKTRVVTDWSHSADIFSGKASKGYMVSEEMPTAVEEFFKKVGHLAFSSNKKPYDDHYTANTRQFKISSEKVSKATSEARIDGKLAAEKTMISLLPGDEHKNEQITRLNCTLAPKYIYIPFWKISYNYENTEYSVIITATNKEKSEIEGTKPVHQDNLMKGNKMKTKAYISILVSIVSFVIYSYGGLSGSINGIFALLFFVGLIAWLFYVIKRFRFRLKNKASLKNNLRNNQEYMELLKKYPE